MTIVKVEHEWDDSKGRCYDCGDPALYCLPDMYGEDKPLTTAMLMCPVCAALHTCEGDGRLVHLFPEDYDTIADREIADFFPIKETA